LVVRRFQEEQQLESRQTGKGERGCGMISLTGHLSAAKWQESKAESPESVLPAAPSVWARPVEFKSEVSGVLKTQWTRSRDL